jgi:hypothetical protein
LADITFLDSVPPALAGSENQFYAHAATEHLAPGTTYYYVSAIAASIRRPAD